MINPNATATHFGRVVNLKRSLANQSLSITVLLESGHLVEELGFVYHKTLAVGDLVRCVIGFSMMTDRFGIKHVAKITKRNKRYSAIENRVNRQGYYTAIRSNLKAVSNE